MAPTPWHGGALQGAAALTPCPGACSRDHSASPPSAVCSQHARPCCLSPGLGGSLQNSAGVGDLTPLLCPDVCRSPTPEPDLRGGHGGVPPPAPGPAISKPVGCWLPRLPLGLPGRPVPCGHCTRCLVPACMSPGTHQTPIYLSSPVSRRGLGARGRSLLSLPSLEAVAKFLCPRALSTVNVACSMDSFGGSGQVWGTGRGGALMSGP